MCVRQLLALSRVAYTMEPTIELHAEGRRTDESLPYDAMDVRCWSRRARVVYEAPPSILATYRPLSSGTFAKLCAVSTPEVHDSSITTIGDVGLGLSLDENRKPVVSVETAALYQLVQTPGEAEDVPPEWLSRLQSQWTSGMCVFMHHAKTGWRGCFAEHRLWSAILLSGNGAIKTPYCKPTVRAWLPDAILADLKACVGAELVMTVAATVADMGFDGAPDLVLYHHGKLWFVEVKSATDNIRESQVQMMKKLSRIKGVDCQVCCPAPARKRMASAMAQSQATSSDSSQD